MGITVKNERSQIVCRSSLRAFRRQLLRALARVGASLVLSILCPHAFANAVGTSISERFHTHWIASDGTPTITSIAEGEDGYLWLGTEHGLFYFDGISFRAYQLANQGDVLSRHIAVVASVPGGGLWIGYQLGGASFLKDGKLHTYSKADGLSEGCVRAFAVDKKGVVWAATEFGLVRFLHSHWENAGTHWSYPKEYPDNLFVDSRGSLWSSTRTGLSILREGESDFQVLDRKMLQNVDFTESPDGTLWLASLTGSVRAISTRNGRYTARGRSYPYRSEGIHVDRSGALWITTINEGIFRIANPEENPTDKAETNAAEHFRVQDGLSSDFAYDVIEGREGGIWL